MMQIIVFYLVIFMITPAASNIILNSIAYGVLPGYHNDHTSSFKRYI